jgi:hypothetical protein
MSASITRQVSGMLAAFFDWEKGLAQATRIEELDDAFSLVDFARCEEGEISEPGVIFQNEPQACGGWRSELPDQ